MKHLKKLGAVVIASVSLMAFAGSASAASALTSPAGTEYTGEIHMTLEPGTTSLTRAGIESTCSESTMNGMITANSTAHAESPLSALTFGKCTQHTKVINPGSLTVNDKGEVFIAGRRVETVVTGIATCFYGAETGSVKIGTLTGGTPATIDINTTTLQREAGSNTFFCASVGTWTGSYVVTTPGTLSSDPRPVALTSPAGTEYTGEIHATLETGTSLLTKAGIENTCSESTMKGTITANSTAHAESSLSALTFGKCTQHTNVINPGSLTVNDKGEAFISGRRVETVITGVATCFYGAETGSVKIGTLTGGTPATLDINTTTVQRLAGSNTFFCASTGTWTGSYVVTTPGTLILT